jgi:hypothetical protein
MLQSPDFNPLLITMFDIKEECPLVQDLHILETVNYEPRNTILQYLLYHMKKE